jgi:hypothetical protein
MTTYTTLAQKTFKVPGTKKFIEVSRQLASGGRGADNEYVAIARGYLEDDGEKKYKGTTQALPPDPELLEEICAAVMKMADDPEDVDGEGS